MFRLPEFLTITSGPENGVRGYECIIGQYVIYNQVSSTVVQSMVPVLECNLYKE